MAKSTLHFDVLEQERDTFALADGAEIEFRNRSDFSAREQALGVRLGERVERLMKQMERRPGDDKLADTLEGEQRKFLRLILPDIPDDLLSDLNAGKMGIIITWWMEQQNERYGADGMAAAGANGDYGDAYLGEG